MMNTIQKNVWFVRLTGLIAVCLACGQTAVADLTPPIQPAGGVVYCTHGTPGWTATTPPQWFSASQLSDIGYGVGVGEAVTNQGFLGTWTFQFSTAASGSINVTTYTPRDGPAACEHGATMVISPSGVTLPPGQQLQWLQLLTYTVTPNCVPPGYPTSASGRVDPAVGYSKFTVDNLPFYYNVSGTNWLMPTDKHFEDAPATYPLDADVPHSGDWDFQTMIASWSGNFNNPGDNVVTIYGMEEWGYTFECVPEPATSVLLLFALACFGCWRMAKLRPGR